MIDPEDTISLAEAQQALFEKLGIPSAAAAQLAKKLFEDMFGARTGEDPAYIWLMDHPFVAEKVQGTYCISRKELEKVLAKTQPDPEILRLLDEGEDFIVE